MPVGEAGGKADTTSRSACLPHTTCAENPEGMLRKER
jgi:hypothetical protein